MTSKDPNAPLYGVPRPAKKATGREISSSNNLAFTSQLSSLISSSRGYIHYTQPQQQKRALKDLDPDNISFDQKHSTAGEALDEAIWHRSKRKMEEKARLYAAMKRGDVEDSEERHMVDFDRKWAEARDKGEKGDEDSSSDEGVEEEEKVEYVDEFGRTRTGTRAEAAREKRRQMLVQEDDGNRARPAAPSNIIYGDTVQSSAFNPDEPVAAAMAALAAKRDRSATPPPAAHFDASKEIRSKGVGFMQFSADGEERKAQMENLERERKETERKRAERDKRVQERKEEVERRRKELREKRGKRKADEFLEGLGMELGASMAGRREDNAGEESQGR
ncbi:hypothetical protein H2203_000031 [Taxawa tesnikishii (nom. ined.)]|nr:hypothetical protein H2203_000031 [Dothideales sp. JES 119]